MFRRHPLQDTSVLEHNDTVYVLFDRPSRVFLHTENRCRIFGNVWLLNGSLIFRGLCHVSLSRSCLTYIQIVLEYLREKPLSEILVPDIFYGTVNIPWCALGCTTTLGAVPD
jgi:hypothetical protein